MVRSSLTNNFFIVSFSLFRRSFRISYNCCLALYLANFTRMTRGRGLSWVDDLPGRCGVGLPTRRDLSMSLLMISKSRSRAIERTMSSVLSPNDFGYPEILTEFRRLYCSRESFSYSILLRRSRMPLFSSVRGSFSFFSPFTSVSSCLTCLFISLLASFTAFFSPFLHHGKLLRAQWFQFRKHHKSQFSSNLYYVKRVYWLT